MEIYAPASGVHCATTAEPVAVRLAPYPTKSVLQPPAPYGGGKLRGEKGKVHRPEVLVGHEAGARLGSVCWYDPSLEPPYSQGPGHCSCTQSSSGFHRETPVLVPRWQSPGDSRCSCPDSLGLLASVERSGCPLGPAEFLFLMEPGIEQAPSIESSFLSYRFCLFIFRERGTRKRGRETSKWERNRGPLPLKCPQLGTWATTQARALTGTRTSDPSGPGTTPNPLSHTGQGQG